jgi:hypothetical protein
MIDILCRCGHRKKFHQYVGLADASRPNYHTWCRYCKEWHDYCPDNLITIEQLAKERKLI